MNKIIEIIEKREKKLNEQVLLGIGNKVILKVNGNYFAD
jgi:hypothetical protein